MREPTEPHERRSSRAWTRIERLSWIITIVGISAVVAGVWFGFSQLVDAQRTIGTTVDARTFAMDQVFIDHPELRPYFYDNQPLPDDPIMRAEVLATSETLLDFLDGVFNDSVNSVNSGSWGAYTRFIYRSSPAVRETLRSHCDWYTYAHFVTILGSLGLPTTCNPSDP